MLIMRNRKQTLNRRNRTARSRKNQNAWRKGNSQILKNIRSRHLRTSRDERKTNLFQTNENISLNHSLLQESPGRDKNLDCPTCKILGATFEMDETRCSTNGPECKKAYDDA